MNIKDLRVGTPVIYHGVDRKYLTHVVGFECIAYDTIMVRILFDGQDIPVKFSDISIADFEIPERPILEEILTKQKDKS